MSAILRCLTAGSVDDGKSTLLGRLLHEAGAVYDDHLRSLRGSPERQVDYSWVTDGLKAEREQGITIDVAYRYLRLGDRMIIFADAPGHEQYTRNMATAASKADVALLLVDVTKGPLPQTHRHAYIAWLFGVRQFIVAVNKMDLVNFEEAAFRRTEKAMEEYVSRLGSCSLVCIPTAAPEGHNLHRRSMFTPWFHGEPVRSVLEGMPGGRDAEGPLRFAVQGALRGASGGRRIAGRILRGVARVGDPVILPEGSSVRLDAIHCGSEALLRAGAGQSVSLTLVAEHDVARGAILSGTTALPQNSRRLAVTAIWMDSEPADFGKSYLLKHVCGEREARISALRAVVVPDSLKRRKGEAIEANDIAEINLALQDSIIWDPYSECRATGSAILIDAQSQATVAALLFDRTAETAAGEEENKAATEGAVIWLTGLSSAGKTTLAAIIYERLRAEGRQCEWLDGDAIRAQLSRDLGFSRADRNENVRRIGYIAALLSQHGVTVVVSAMSPHRAGRDEVRQKLANFVEVYVNAPVGVCRARDVKGLYRLAAEGRLQHLSGLDDPYEAPLTPEVECRTDVETVSESADKILAAVSAFLRARARRIRF